MCCSLCASYVYIVRYAVIGCVLFCLLCVFFFKQKTAYEMRISDWSSDVCSSDLKGNGPCDGAVSFSQARRPGVRRRAPLPCRSPRSRGRSAERRRRRDRKSVV